MQNEQYREPLSKATKALKEFVAQELTCGDMQLQSHEVSIRLLKIEGDGMLADVELEVVAHVWRSRQKARPDMLEYSRIRNEQA